MAFVALDLETTWLDSKKDKIIEIALVKFDEKTFEVIDTFSTLVNPGISIPDLNYNITWISNEMVMQSPTFDEIREDIVHFIGALPIVWHNVNFDRGFLMANGVGIDYNPYIDTFFLANSFLFQEMSISLESICAYFKISLPQAHRALHDTEATVKVLNSLTSFFHHLSEGEKQALSHILSYSSDTNIIFLKEFLFGIEIPSVSFDVFKNLLLKKVGFYMQIPQEAPEKKLDIQSAIKKLWILETRENQKELIQYIYTKVSKGNMSIIEAPTGIWKTMGYLIPSYLYSLESSEQVYISTKTKILQDQMYHKEIPKLEGLLWQKIESVKIKGQENYFSFKSYFEWLTELEPTYEKMSFLSKITLWLFKTIDGELDELNYYNEESKLVRFVYSSIDESMSEKNPYKEYEFLYKSRKRLETARIVILNHAVVFSDLKNEGEISKNIQNIVFDEAHTLEDVLTSSLKRRYNLRDIRFLFADMLLKWKKSSFSELHKLESQVNTLLVELEFFDDMLTSMISKERNLKEDYISFLPKEPYYSESILHSVQGITFLFSQLIDTIKLWNGLLKYVFILSEISSVFDTVFSKEKSKEEIQIINYNQFSWLTFEYTPLNCGDFCDRYMWQKFRSVILLSATMRVNKSFDFIRKNLSIPQNVEEMLFPSDFDYSTQAELVVINNLWSVKNNLASVLFFLKNFISKVGGKSLILFTSFSLIRSAYLDLNMYFKSEGISILAQWFYGSKFRILDKFKQNNEKSVIFGTDSFWEWVDIPWEALSYLVIHKFPFSVPTDPIFIARSTLYKDSFWEYAVPKAILKLKQGMWRLIRTKTDTWKIILLDDRIFSTTWWKAFIDAFPEDIKVTYISSDQFLDTL